jgi:uncharacterized membrane protein
LFDFLNATQLILYIGLLALLGQGLLFVLAGQNRDRNIFYQLFQILNKPWLFIARKLSPARILPKHIPLVAFLVMSVMYVYVTLAKIEHCISIAMQGCK